MAWTTDEIHTERLTLRPAREADRPQLERLLTDPDVRRYLGGPVTGESIAGWRAQPLGERWGGFVAVVDAKAVGSVTLGRDRDELEVSYVFLPESWGSGYASEAASAVLDWVWESLDDESVIAVTQAANDRSLRLLDRLGFERQATFVEFDAPQIQLRIRRPDPGAVASHA